MQIFTDFCGNVMNWDISYFIGISTMFQKLTRNAFFKDQGKSFDIEGLRWKLLSFDTLSPRLDNHIDSLNIIVEANTLYSKIILFDWNSHNVNINNRIIAQKSS